LENMMIALANFKGGVGKSTLTVHLALWLFDQGFRVAVLDADNQRSSSQWISEAEPKITLSAVSTPEECLSEARGLATTHDFLIGDGPAGLGEMSRTLLVLADLALIPITPSALDTRSVQQAISVFKFAQELNGGRPEGWLVLNRMKKRDVISRELQAAAPKLGVQVAQTTIRDLQPYRDAVQHATVVTRMGRRAVDAAQDIDSLFRGILGGRLQEVATKRDANLKLRRVENG
jgi:chromosome partitioning protein